MAKKPPPLPPRVFRNAQPDLIRAEKDYARALSPLGTAVIAATSALVLRRLKAIVGDPESPNPGWRRKLDAELERSIDRTWRAYPPRRAATEISKQRKRVNRLNLGAMTRKTREVTKSKDKRDAIGLGVATADTTEVDEQWGAQQAEAVAANVQTHTNRVRNIVVAGVVAAIALGRAKKVVARRAVTTTRITITISTPAESARTLNDIKVNAEEVNGMTRRAMVNTAADATQTLNGNLSEVRWENAGVRRYKWITVGDSRVRPAHRARHNEIFRWSRPPPDGHPGEPFGCRCEAQPMISSFRETAPGMKPSERRKVVSKFNRREVSMIEGLVGEQVEARRVAA